VAKNDEANRKKKTSRGEGKEGAFAGRGEEGGERKGYMKVF